MYIYFLYKFYDTNSVLGSILLIIGLINFLFSFIHWSLRPYPFLYRCFFYHFFIRKIHFFYQKKNGMKNEFIYVFIFFIFYTTFSFWYKKWIFLWIKNFKTFWMSISCTNYFSLFNTTFAYTLFTLNFIIVITLNVFYQNLLNDGKLTRDR